MKSWNCEITTCEVLDKKYRIKEFWVALIPASAASLKVTNLLFVKQQHNQGELQSVFVILFSVLFIGQLRMQF